MSAKPVAFWSQMSTAAPTADAQLIAEGIMGAPHHDTLFEQPHP